MAAGTATRAIATSGVAGAPSVDRCRNKLLKLHNQTDQAGLPADPCATDFR